MKRSHKLIRTASLLLSLALLFSLLPGLGMKANADGEKAVACLGTASIGNHYPNEIWIEKTTRTDVRCLVMYPRENTRGPNGDRTSKLDFAFLSDRLKEIPIYGVFNKKVLESVTGTDYLSDHNMIGIELI